MVDIHTHMLFGVDDGSPDLETSLKMARLAVREGTTKVVCTPHASSRYGYPRELIESNLQRFRDAVRSEGLPLELGIGADFHLSFENVERAIGNSELFTINKSKYLLVELPDFGLAPQTGEVFHTLRLAGMVPILTHPERNLTLQRDLRRIAEWLNDGLLLQVTAGSLTGRHGRTARAAAEIMIRNGWAHAIASDSHNISTRPPGLRSARKRIVELTSEEYADVLLRENPTAIFLGQPLPQPANVSFPAKALRERGTWWTKWFRA